MADIDDLMSAGFDMLEDLDKLKDEVERANKIKDHISTAESKFKVTVPQFDPDLDWLNVARPLSIQDDLRGKIVVLDFFTYCCINCMNVLPDLNTIEEKYEVSDGVAIIGVHSAKFTNEKLTDNIRNALFKYGIKHPVVNDRECVLWNALNIVCWPTFVVVSPTGKALLTLLGEGHCALMIEFLGVAVDFFNGLRLLSPHQLPIQLEKRIVSASSILRFPGKISKDAESDSLVVSDSGNNRIIVFDSTGLVQHVIGRKEKGFRDGAFDEALFNSPQGVVMHMGVVYVADTGNHAIRRIYVGEQTVDTMVGTGQQGNDYCGGKAGTKQSLSSPWDIAFGNAEGIGDNDILYIAMAGTHQIWALFLRDATWYGPWKVRKGTCFHVVGSGVEQNKNDRDPKRAGLAQPSGLVLSHELGMMYFADSESSSIRRVFIKDGSVTALVGGEPRPQYMSESLFAYGDTDGMSLKAKLQHPMGVELLTPEGPLLVADTYNHKIKKVDLMTRECTTYIGTGECGNKLGDQLTDVQLNEPNGLYVDVEAQKLYVVDTNNHEIKVVNIENSTISRLTLKLPDESSTTTPHETFKRLASLSKAVTKLPAVTLQPQATLNFELTVVWKSGLHLTPGAQSAWQIFSNDADLSTHMETLPIAKGVFSTETTVGQCSVELPALFTPQSECLLHVEIVLYMCDTGGVCKMKTEVYSVAVAISPSGEKCETVVVQTIPA